MIKLYDIVFEDNTVFEGGISYFESKWKDLPDKKIRTFIYYLPHNDALILSGYERYYHCIEGTQDIYNGDGLLKPRFIYLLAQKNTDVKVYKIDITKPNIEIKIYNKDDAFIQNRNKIYWHKGVI
jgi:hypothetical protein